MRSLATAFAIGVLTACAVAETQEPAPSGKQVFDRHCAECHAPGFGHPGTQQLEWKKGAAFAVLEERTDLAAAYVTAVVRNGLLEMPPFRPTEITDAELAALNAYLAKTPAR